MAEKKITKRDNYNALLAITEVASNPTLVEFIKHELELLDRKNSGERKPTAVQIANEKLKNDIVDFLEQNHNKLYTATDINKGVNSLQDLSLPKITSLLTQLYDHGSENARIERIEDKKKTYFRAMQ